LIYFIISALIVLLDQASKYFMSIHLSSDKTAELIPGVVGLVYVEYTGAAFSFLWDMRGCSSASPRCDCLLVLLLARYGNKTSRSDGLPGMRARRRFREPDRRALFGYVVDFFEFEFVHFAVFNVADVFIRSAGSSSASITFSSGTISSGNFHGDSCLPARGKGRRPARLRRRGDIAGEAPSGEAPSADDAADSDSGTILLKADTDGVRLDVFLAEKLGDLCRSAAVRLIENGCVRLGGEPARKKTGGSRQGRYTRSSARAGRDVDAGAGYPLDIVYEDADVLVVNKPRGMVVHPAPGHPEGTLVNALLAHCGDSLSGIGGEKRPGIVHRIDKDTSGLLIAAKNDLSHRALSAQLKNRSLSRIYEAVVVGNLKNDAGTVDAPLGRHPRDRKRQTVTDKNARGAVTHYEVLGRYNGYTHIRCRLETGRTHQIRVHMAHIGHPVLGDRIYGRKTPEKGLAGQCLHARQLRFVHPRTGERIELSTELPPYFTEVLAKLGTVR
jgi:23S rRNA pseudouridine1911/1915/1917 synthase